MANSGRHVRSEVERALNSGAVGIFSPEANLPSTSSGFGARNWTRPRPNHTVADERSALFQRNNAVGVGQRSNFTTARNYRPSSNARNTGRGRRGGGSGAASRSGPYQFNRNQPTTNQSHPQTGKSDVPAQKLCCKDIYLVDVGVTSAPRGAKRAPLFLNGQVKSAFKLDSTWSAEEIEAKFEREFHSILDQSKPAPRYCTFLSLSCL